MKQGSQRVPDDAEETKKKRRTWDESFEELQKVYYATGSSDVKSNNKELYQWVRDQRKLYKVQQNSTRTCLSDDKIAKLKSIHFRWEVRDDSWEKMFGELEAYKTKFNTLTISRLKSEYHRLLRWLNEQKAIIRHRVVHTAKELERIERLRQLGVVLHEKNSQATGLIETAQDEEENRQSDVYLQSAAHGQGVWDVELAGATDKKTISSIYDRLVAKKVVSTESSATRQAHKCAVGETTIEVIDVSGEVDGTGTSSAVSPKKEKVTLRCGDYIQYVPHPRIGGRVEYRVGCITRVQPANDDAAIHVDRGVPIDNMWIPFRQVDGSTQRPTSDWMNVDEATADGDLLLVEGASMVAASEVPMKKARQSYEERWQSLEEDIMKTVSEQGTDRSPWKRNMLTVGPKIKFEHVKGNISRVGEVLAYIRKRGYEDDNMTLDSVLLQIEDNPVTFGSFQRTASGQEFNDEIINAFLLMVDNKRKQWETFIGTATGKDGHHLGIYSSLALMRLFPEVFGQWDVQQRVVRNVYDFSVAKKLWPLHRKPVQGVVRGVCDTSANPWDYHALLLPVNIGRAHWGLIEIDISNRTLKAYDSMKQPSSVQGDKRTYHYYFERIYQWLYDWMKHDPRKGISFDHDCWEEREEEAPQQLDGCSCGVFLCMFVYCLTSKHCNNPSTSVDSWVHYLVNNYREQIAFSLLEGDMRVQLQIAGKAGRASK